MVSTPTSLGSVSYTHLDVYKRQVKEFVKNAKDADMTIYGHTLAWHAQAANKYLKNLIKDKELPPDPHGGNKYLEIACGEDVYKRQHS